MLDIEGRIRSGEDPGIGKPGGALQGRDTTKVVLVLAILFSLITPLTNPIHNADAANRYPKGARTTRTLCTGRKHDNYHAIDETAEKIQSRHSELQSEFHRMTQALLTGHKQ